jgi:hypothetical protein
MNSSILGLTVAVVFWWQACSSSQAQSYYFTTLAGTVSVTGTNDGPGTSARFRFPRSVAVDSTDTVYVTDTYNNAIRKITRGGLVSTLAGLPGAMGATNDGTGSSARFSWPAGIAVDSANQVYVADTMAATIRAITPGGVVTTIAGWGGLAGTNDGVGSAARFNQPRGIACAGTGTLYVADFNNHTLRKLVQSGSTWTVITIAGKAGTAGTNDGPGSSARFNGPWGVAVDAAGNVYVADSGTNTIRRVALVSGTWQVSTIAGTAGHPGYQDGPGSGALFYTPAGVAADGAGNVYVGDRDGSTIRRMAPPGAQWSVSTIGGTPESYGCNNGFGNEALLYNPEGVAADSAGNIFVADYSNQVIRRGTLLLDIAPTLRCACVAGQMVISWPLSAARYYLESSASVGPDAYWSEVTAPINAVGDSFMCNVGAGVPPLFYRLHLR